MQVACVAAACMPQPRCRVCALAFFIILHSTTGGSPRIVQVSNSESLSSRQLTGERSFDGLHIPGNTSELMNQSTHNSSNSSAHTYDSRGPSPTVRNTTGANVTRTPSMVFRNDRGNSTAASLFTTVTSTSTSTLTATTITSTHPVDWLSWISRVYYINLPIDNWSAYGLVKTEWTKIQIIGTPKLGDVSVTVDLHDWRYSSSNGETSVGHNLTQVEWGITGDCRGSLESSMSINLVGTPFSYEPQHMKAHGEEAHGTVTCSPNNQSCTGHCGGWCGYCGFGAASETATATLVVVDRGMYDAALHDMYTDAREALHTTTVTSTTSRTSTVTTTTVTTSTVTSSTSTTSKPLFLALASASKESSSSAVGIMAFLSIVIGVGVLFGCMVRRGLLKRCLERKYGQFDDSTVEARQVPPQALGGSFPTDRIADERQVAT